MRWEDCVKRDLERVGGEWRTTAKQLELETVDRERSERKTRKEKTKNKTTVTVVNIIYRHTCVSSKVFDVQQLRDGGSQRRSQREGMRHDPNPKKLENRELRTMQ